MTWIAMRQQDGPSKGTIRGLQSPKQLKNAILGPIWPLEIGANRFEPSTRIFW